MAVPGAREELLGDRDATASDPFPDTLSEMALFNRGPAADEVLARDYLRLAPPGPRTNNLGSACALQISELPVARRFGELLTVERLAPASAQVRGIMHQDRDLSAWIARKSAVLLHSIFQAGMSGDLGSKMTLALDSVGLTLGDGIRARSDRVSGVPEVQRAGAEGLGTTALSILTVATSVPSTWEPHERRVYEDLYTGQSGEDVEGLAYDLTAWFSVVIGRLLNAGEIQAGLPFLSGQYRTVPSMSAAGWYPNPPKNGDVSTGSPQFQRFWDGANWTDRVRVRNGRGWETGAVSLHDRPTE